MDSQTGNDEFWHFSRFQKLVSVWYIFFLNFEQKYLKQWKITKFSVRKSMNIHRILQFGLKLIIPGRLWRCKEYDPQIMNLLCKFTSLFLSLHPSSVHIHKSLLKIQFGACLSYLCGLFSIWILMPEPRMGLIFMDSQKGNDHSMLLISIKLLILHISVWCKCHLLQSMPELL